MKTFSKEEFLSTLRDLKTTHRNDIKLDEEDFCTLTKCKNTISVFTSEGIDENAPYKMMKSIVEQIRESPLTITKDTNILVHFGLHPNILSAQLVESMNLIYQVIHSEADAMFFTSNIQSNMDNQVRTTAYLYEHVQEKFIPANNT